MSDHFDFIAKELNESQTPVSYRLLSRKLRIHVNEAKNELNRYFQENKSSERPLHATFMVTGEQITTSGTTHEDEMDVDSPVAKYDVVELKCILVAESNLEETKASFSNLRSCHIYSLSCSNPTAFTINGCNDLVRELDSSSKFDDLKNLGKVLGLTSTGPRKAVKTDLKRPLQPTPSSSNPIGKDVAKSEASEPTQKASPAVKEKPKATGKLDFFSANRAKGASTSKASQSPATLPPTKEQVKKPVETKPKNIVKREQNMPASSGSDNKGKQKESEMKPIKKEPSPEPIETSSVRIKKGALLSDDEDEDAEDVKPKRSRLRKRVSSIEDSDSERDRSLRAMMDIDDSEVIRVSASKPSEVLKSEEREETEPETQDTEEPSQVADTAMDEDSDPAPKVKPRKRKEKKVVPVGRNGLKKKRIMKSRMSTDARGFMVTEDYSSYESVDEEEEDAGAKEKASSSKVKAKEPKTTTAAKAEREADKPAPSKTQKLDRKPSKQGGDLKRKPSTAGNQKSLKSFFGGNTNK